MATSNNTENKLITTQGEAWKGYTIDELKYHRAVSLVKLEMQKARLAESFTAVTGTLAETRSRIFGSSGKRFDGKLKFVNYLILGYKSMKTAVNLWNSFKRKRR